MVVERWCPEVCARNAKVVDPVSVQAGLIKDGWRPQPVTRAVPLENCATVSLHDEKGAGLFTIRYEHMPNGNTRAGIRSRAYVNTTGSDSVIP